MKPFQMKLKAVILLMLALSTTQAAAYDFKADGLYYDINEDGTTVSVTKPIEDANTIVNWKSGDVVIPGSVTNGGITYKVTAIAKLAFASCRSLTSVIIPDSVISIGDYAFFNCYGMTSVTIGNSVSSIGYAAFYYCSSLSDVELPGSVTSIGDWTFGYCWNLINLVIPSSVTTIGYATFYHCSSLRNIAFSGSITSFADYSFYECFDLAQIEIPKSVTSIGDRAFFSCGSLSSLSVPNSVANIGLDAFAYCGLLTSIEVESGNVVYDSRGGCNAIIETATNTLIAGCQNTTIPNTVKAIGDRAFMGCYNLTSVTIPNSVTSIGENAFYFCSGLTSIEVESGNAVYDSRGGCNAIIETATNALFAGCQNTAIPNSVTSIGDLAFYGCKGLKSMTIPNSVTSIGEYAFSYCAGLMNMTIPNSVTSIGGGAFDKCTGLTSINSMILDPAKVNMGDGVFYAVPTDVCQLIVPKNCGEKYRNADQWEDFVKIVELTGDVDGNGVVNGSDVTALYNLLLNGVQPAGDADVDGNGVVNGSDVTALYNLLLN